MSEVLFYKWDGCDCTQVVLMLWWVQCVPNVEMVRNHDGGIRGCKDRKMKQKNRQRDTGKKELHREVILCAPLWNSV